MRRIEQDPEEIREMEEALSRAATPTHEQGEVRQFPHGLHLIDPLVPEKGWERPEPPELVA